MSSGPSSLSIVDVHSHHVPPRWGLTTTAGLTGAARDRWLRINGRIADPAALVESIEDGDLAGRVVNIPTALFSPPGEVPSPDTVRAANDAVADLVATRRGLTGLASVDAFGGDAAAREVTRAVRDLGLRGVFVESAKGDLLLDAPEARPTLAAAAALGVPVFAHPINPQPLLRQMARYPSVGTLFARGTVNAATLVALLEGGPFDELPDLKVVVTTLAIGAVMLAADFGPGGREAAEAALRRHVFIDTMGFHPTLIRASVDLLGVGNVLAGSDWPIVSDGPVARRLADALDEAGLTPAEQDAVAGGNARRLFRI